MRNISCDPDERSLFSPSSIGQRAPEVWFSRKARLAGWERLSVGVLGIGLLAVLGIAGWLEPDPAGFGTHRQLGLPTCSFKARFGWPCPSCGMTTAWAHLVRGEFVPAWRANIAGVVLALLAMIAAPWAIGSAAGGRYLGVKPSSITLFVTLLGAFLIALVQWLLRTTWVLGG